MSQTSPQSSDPRSLIRYACIALAVTMVALWTLYLVRGPLLTIYVSALFATGLAPLVQLIERQRIRVVSHRRLPRPAAILVIYGTVLGAVVALGAAVLPPIWLPPLLICTWWRACADQQRQIGRAHV